MGVKNFNRTIFGDGFRPSRVGESDLIILKNILAVKSLFATNIFENYYRDLTGKCVKIAK